MDEENLICSGGHVDVSGVPDEIKLLPLGLVKSQKGDFVVDDESFEMILSNFLNRKIDMVIDYEHQTLYNVQAPAGGWIKEIKKGTDAIIAKVEWTERAKEYLKNKEYRYLSPVVSVRKSDKKACRMDSVALTNTPAIDGMYSIVNSTKGTVNHENIGGIKMDWKEVAKLLGLPETATEEDVKKALETAKEAVKEEEGEKDSKEPEAGKEPTGSETVVANSTILSMLGLDAKAKTEDVAATIMSLKAGEVDVKTELLVLKRKLQEQEATELVTNALKTGKITAAQKDWATDYALKDSAGFKGFVEKAPVVVPVGKLELIDAPNTSEPECDMQILKNCGLTEEDIKKYYKAEVE